MKKSKPADSTDIRRINLAVTNAWSKKVDAWRVQPDLPTMPEAIRRLVEMSLERSAANAGVEG
jgi:hypothetical protein